MQIRIAFAAAAFLFACDSGGSGGVTGAAGGAGTGAGGQGGGVGGGAGTTYSFTFVCEADGGAPCPPGGECPVVPEGSGTCGDLPGLLGHPAIPIDMARPVGCQARLPFGNPYYADSQVTCTCSTIVSPSPAWLCPI